MIKNLNEALIEASYVCTPSFKENVERLRAYARESDKAAKSIDIRTAYEIGEVDAQQRLLRDTLALCNHLDIIAMLAAHVKDDIYRLKTAQQIYLNYAEDRRVKALERELKKEYNRKQRAKKVACE